MGVGDGLGVVTAGEGEGDEPVLGVTEGVGVRVGVAEGLRSAQWRSFCATTAATVPFHQHLVPYASGCTAPAAPAVQYINPDVQVASDDSPARRTQRMPSGRPAQYSDSGSGLGLADGVGVPDDEAVVVAVDEPLAEEEAVALLVAVADELPDALLVPLALAVAVALLDELLVGLTLLLALGVPAALGDSDGVADGTGELVLLDVGAASHLIVVSGYGLQEPSDVLHVDDTLPL
jgi:hypothetical protein